MEKQAFTLRISTQLDERENGPLIEKKNKCCDALNFENDVYSQRLKCVFM